MITSKFLWCGVFTHSVDTGKGACFHFLYIRNRVSILSDFDGAVLGDIVPDFVRIQLDLFSTVSANASADGSPPSTRSAGATTSAPSPRTVQNQEAIDRSSERPATAGAPAKATAPEIGSHTNSG